MRITMHTLVITVAPSVAERVSLRVLAQPPAGSEREPRPEMIDDAGSHGFRGAEPRTNWRSVKFVRQYTVTNSVWA